MEVVEPTDILPAPVLADVKQGKVTGIIIPPPDIRAVVDKTAQFVARNGKSFEARISNSAEGKTAKFNFMKPFDPYHAYYESKINEFEQSLNKPKDNIVKEEIKPKPIEEEIKQKVISSDLQKSTSKKASLTTPIARFAMNKPKEASHPFEFSVGHPTGLTAVDVEIIKLTAQYTALNGRDFLGGLAQREQRNPQFDFLKPTHVLFSYFTSLVDAYAKVILPNSQLKERIKLKSDKMKVLEGCVQRWEWSRADEDRKNRDSAEADAERIAFQSIDWMEFVVVETIDFPEDDLAEIPGMLGLGFGEYNTSCYSGNGNTEMEEDDNNNEYNQSKESFNNNAVEPPPPIIKTDHRSLSAIHQIDEEEDTEMDYDPEIKVVTNYIPRMASGSAAAMTMVDPITGKIMPVDEMGEHMRIQLLDPRWRIEQQRFQDKQKDTGFAEGDSIADSLKQFARKRGDIFGSDSVNNQIEKKIKPDVATEADVETTWLEHEKNQIAQQQQLRQQEQYKLQMALHQQQQQQPHIRLVEPIVQPISKPSYSIPSSIPPPIVQRPLTQQILPHNPSYISTMPVPVALPTPQWQPPIVTHIPPAHITPMVPQSQFAAPPPFIPPPAREIVKSGPILIPSDVFYSNNQGEIKFLVSIPHDQSNEQWNLNGQTLTIKLPNVMSSVKDAKDLISLELGNIPHNKYQLKELSSGFLKDASNFASLNINGGNLEFHLKSRGGKR